MGAGGDGTYLVDWADGNAHGRTARAPARPGAPQTLALARGAASGLLGVPRVSSHEGVPLLPVPS